MDGPYSKRKKTIEGPPATYRFDLPIEFRNQVVFIWSQTVGFTEAPIPSGHVAPYEIGKVAILQANQFFRAVRSAFCEAHGFLSLPGISEFYGPCVAVRTFLQTCADDHALDLIELSFHEMLQAQSNSNFVAFIQPALEAQDAISKLNQRFQEHAIGYRFEAGQIVRIDSEFLYSETTEPAVGLLHQYGYEGALEEFHLALKYYRQGPDHYDDCLTNCLKAVESTLQKITELRRWEMPGEAKFDNLFAEVRKKGLFPAFLGTHLGEVKKFLQAVAVIRNEEGGHGSGSQPNHVPDHLVAYQIHLTGSAIVFLIRCNENYGEN